MCYKSPAPRCSPHAREALKAAQSAVAEADRNLWYAKDDYEKKKTVAAEAKLRAAENEFKRADAEAIKAKKAYDKAAENKAKAYKEYKTAMNDYAMTPEGIQKLRDQGKDEQADAAQFERQRRIELAKKQEGGNAHAGSPDYTFGIDEIHLATSGDSDAWDDTPDPRIHALVMTYGRPYTQSRLAKNKHVSEAIHLKLAQTGNEFSLNALAENEASTTRVLETVFGRNKSRSQVILLERSNLPISLRQKISRVDKYDVRWCVTQSKHTSEELRSSMATDPREEVRAGVASMSRVERTLVQLSSDDASQVRASVARNGATPASVVEKLARDSDVKVRMASLATVPQALRDELASDPDSRVRGEAARYANASANALNQLSQDSSPEVRKIAASNKNLPSESFVRLSKDTEPDIVREVATNPNAPVAVLAKLAKSTDRYTRMNVAKNRSTPKETLEFLAKARDREVRFTAIRALQR